MMGGQNGRQCSLQTNWKQHELKADRECWKEANKQREALDLQINGPFLFERDDLSEEALPDADKRLRQRQNAYESQMPGGANNGRGDDANDYDNGNLVYGIESIHEGKAGNAAKNRPTARWIVRPACDINNHKRKTPPKFLSPSRQPNLI
jgi:hypothetical protein